MTSDGRPRVLLADDDEGILSAFRRLLTPACQVVGQVTDVGALFAEATTLRPDVIVIDVFMRPGNGLEACGRLNEALPLTKIVVVTAADDPTIRERAHRLGASAFVPKLRAADDLLAAILREASALTTPYDMVPRADGGGRTP